MTVAYDKLKDDGISIAFPDSLRLSAQLQSSRLRSSMKSSAFTMTRNRLEAVVDEAGLHVKRHVFGHAHEW
ncbi:hypothetical protein BG58_12460 [Caballeronia jiangsuensis]|nr:hypothetical protein BG58_12460 [Caballeronia jiangsuensis]